MAAFVVTKSVTTSGQTNVNQCNFFACDAADAAAAVTAAVAACGGVAAEWTGTALGAGVNVKGKLVDTPDLS